MPSITRWSQYTRLRVADLREQRPELLRVPAVVLVSQRHNADLARDQLERAFEVAIEAAAARRPAQDERGVAAHQPSRICSIRDADEQSSLITHIQRALALGPDGLDLGAEQLHRGLESRHRDRDLGARSADRFVRLRTSVPPSFDGYPGDAHPPGRGVGELDLKGNLQAPLAGICSGATAQ